MIDRVLLVVNRAAATGHGAAAVEALRDLLADALGRAAAPIVEAVEDHAAARAGVRAFLRESGAPAAVIAAGGAGTFRAVVEAACEDGLPGGDRVRVSALRMGSGNALAKHFGVPRRADAAVRGIVANLRAGRTAALGVMRIEVGRRGRPPEVRYGATLCGLGALGRVPGDLARWHARLPWLRRAAARMLGIERLTRIEYALAFLLRTALGGRGDVVDVRAGALAGRLRMLAGAVSSFPIAALPAAARGRAGTGELAVALAPLEAGAGGPFASPERLARRAIAFRLGRAARLEIASTGGRPIEFFIDEDPDAFDGTLAIEMAGPLAFVPGPDYAWPEGGS